MVLKKCKFLLAELALMKQLFRERDRILGHGEHWNWMFLGVKNRFTNVSGDGLEGNILARAYITVSEMGW